MPLAVLIPAFYTADGLVRTLSALASDPVPFDIVVVDDGCNPPVRTARVSIARGR